MKKIKGDIITEIYSGNYDLVFHGCNCYNVMGKGVAKVLSEEFPIIKQADNLLSPGAHKLGRATRADIKLPNGHPVIILNCYTQHFYGTDRTQLDYLALEHILEGIKTKYSDKRILYPKIGSGLAGGDWDIIEKMVDRIFDGLDHTLVYL